MQKEAKRRTHGPCQGWGKPAACHLWGPDSITVQHSTLVGDVRWTGWRRDRAPLSFMTISQMQCFIHIHSPLSGRIQSQ